MFIQNISYVRLLQSFQALIFLEGKDILHYCGCCLSIDRTKHEKKKNNPFNQRLVYFVFNISKILGNIFSTFKPIVAFFMYNVPNSFNTFFKYLNSLWVNQSLQNEKKVSENKCLTSTNTNIVLFIVHGLCNIGSKLDWYNTICFCASNMEHAYRKVIKCQCP